MKEKLRSVLEDVLTSELWNERDSEEIDFLVDTIIEKADDRGLFEDADEPSDE